MTIKRHEAMTCSSKQYCVFSFELVAGGDDSDARQKFTCDFSFANSCRQINIFCAKFIISSHFATMAIGSANPELYHPSVIYLDPNRAQHFVGPDLSTDCKGDQEMPVV